MRNRVSQDFIRIWAYSEQAKIKQIKCDKPNMYLNSALCHISRHVLLIDNIRIDIYFIDQII